MPFNILFDEVELSVRLSTICNHNKIKTLDDLFNLDLITLRRLRNLGLKTIDEINSLRQKYGLEILKYNDNINNIKHDKINANRTNVIYTFNELLKLDIKSILNCKIDEIDLSNRLVNVLHNRRVFFVNDLFSKNITPKILNQLNRIGFKTYTEFKYFYDILEKKVSVIKECSSKFELSKNFINKNLTDLKLSFTLYNALKNLGVYNLKDILNLKISEKDIVTYIGLKSSTLNEFRDLINDINNANEFINHKIEDKNNISVFDISNLTEELKQESVHFFYFSGPTINFLKKNNIEKFSDLSKNDINEFVGLNIHVSTKLNLLIDMLSKSEFNADFIPREAAYYPVWVDNFLKSLKPRSKEILEYRYGIFEEKYTLEEVGKIKGITRERVRQILYKLILKFKLQYSFLLRNLENELKKNVVDNLYPIDFVKYFSTNNSWYKYKVKEPVIIYLNLLNELFPEIPLVYNNKNYSSDLTLKEKDLETEIVEKLKTKLPIKITKNKLFNLSTKISQLRLFDFIRILILSKRINYINDGNNIAISLNRYNITDASNSIFNSCKIPINLNRFKEKLLLYYPSFKNTNNYEIIRMCLINNPHVFRFDNDLFGNRDHLLMLCPEIEQIKDMCFDTMESRKIPTAIYDLVPLIDFNKIKIDPENKNYIIDAIISSDKRFVKLDRLLYGLKKWGQIKYPKVSDKLYEILKNNINPLHLSTLFNKLKYYRSVLEITVSTTLRNDKRIINYPPGWYGLKEFHKQNLNYLLNHAPYLDKLIYSLMPGTTLNEIIKLIDSQKILDMEKLEELLILDKRFIVYSVEKERRVFHKNWPNSKLITSVLKLSANGISLDELLWQLNDSFGVIKQFSLKDIKSCLSSITNVVRIDDKVLLEKEVKVDEDLKDKIVQFVTNQMSEINMLYNLEDMHEMFINIIYPDDNASFHEFRKGFFELLDQNFEQIGTNIFRRINCN